VAIPLFSQEKLGYSVLNGFGDMIFNVSCSDVGLFTKLSIQKTSEEVTSEPTFKSTLPLLVKGAQGGF
jgi:hypothetical protein